MSAYMVNRMKICIISTVAPRQMSMYSIYVNYLTKHNIDFDLIYLDRFSGGDVVKSRNTYRFTMKDNGRLSRYYSYYKFSRYAARVVTRNKYDYLIIWNEMTAGWMSSFLTKKYKSKYCINIRDLFDEFYWPTKLIQPKLEKAIAYADFNTVSSEGYIQFLPKNNYIMFHSLNENFVLEKKGIRRINNGDPITIMYMGNIRFLEKLKSFLLRFRNDSRYIIIIAGNGSESLKPFCDKNGIENVRYIGAFANEETSRIVSKADILYNLYGTENNCLRTALSQKLYISVSLRIPILVYNNTSMFDYADKCGLAFGIEDKPVMDSVVPDELYQWYLSRDNDYIEKRCLRFQEEILNCNKEFYKKLDSVFLN